jgi:hypothetical protein
MGIINTSWARNIYNKSTTVKMPNVLNSYPALLIGVAVVVLASAHCDADVLLKYEMNQLNPQIQDPVNTVAGDILFPGGGLNVFSPYLTLYPTTSNSLSITFTGDYTNMDLALANSAWFTFAVTVGSSVTNLNLTSLTFNAARGGNGTPRGYAIFVTTPTTTDELLKGATDLPTARPNWGLLQGVSLSSVASLQGLTNGQVITFKIAAYTTASTNSVDFDNIALNGYANFTTNQTPPEPLVITNIKPQPNAVDLTWLSNTGKVYSVQYALALGATNAPWQNIVTNIPATAGTNKTSVTLNLGPNPVTNIILQYQLGTNVAQIQNATNTAAGGILTPGLGMSLFNTNSTLTLNGSTVPVLAFAPVNDSTNLSTALANNAWFTFTLTVGSSVTDLDVTNLTFNAARGGAGTPRGYGVYVTTPTTTDELVRGATDLTTARPNSVLQIIDLSSVASLQNLIAGQLVTFKIPVYSPTNTSTLIFDDITVKGNVSPTPTPSNPPYVGAGQLFFRVATPPEFQ